MGLAHCGSILLLTDRLKLRKFEYNDLQAMYEFTSDSDVTRWLVWSEHKDLERTKDVLKRTLNNYADPDYYHWAIEENSSKKMIGSISLSYVDNWNGLAELGYTLNKKFWGKGYATEASKKIIQFAFTRVGFNRIEARTVCNNIASLNVLEKCNMKFEGIERQRYYIAPFGFENAFSYSILKEDFLKYND